MIGSIYGVITVALMNDFRKRRCDATFRASSASRNTVGHVASADPCRGLHAHLGPSVEAAHACAVHVA